MNRFLQAVALIFLFIAANTAWATEPEPGDSCAGYPAGSVMRSGGP
jgi:hypothetical protein